MIDGFIFSEHAYHQMQARNVQPAWVDETLASPERLISLADGHGNTHYLRRIQAFDHRWLRVVVNPNVEPKRIVTVFFDRRIQ